ncbi:MAG: T9SS type A sorting domain-containing protein [Verrucomicrobiota bacterium]
MGNMASFSAVNTGTTPVTATIEVTPTFANGGVSCTGPTKTFTITVNPTAEVDQPADLVFCNGSATTAVNLATVSTGGTTTYAWTNSDSSIGLAGSGTGNIATFTGINSGTLPVTATIVVTPTFANGGVSCTGPTKTFTIIVNPTAQVNAISSQVLCNGSATTAVNFATTGTGGTTTYAWSNDTPGIGLAASGTGNIASFTVINNGTSPVTAIITVTPTFANGGVSCSGPTKSYTITVNPTAEVEKPADQITCKGSSTTAVAFTTTGTRGTTSYAWSNDTPGIGLAASGTGNISSFTAINNGTSPVTATITVTPTFSNGGVSCTGPTNSFTITVNPIAQVNAIENQLLYNGAVTTTVNFSTISSGGTTIYAWSNDTPGIGLAANGTGKIASFTAINNGVAPVTATIVVSPSFDSGSLACTGTTKSFTITVNPTAQVNQPGSQVLCNGSTTTAINFSTINYGGRTTYSWTNSDTSIGLAAGGIGNIAAFQAINNGTSPLVAIITIIPTFENGFVSSSGPAKTITITINPTAQVNQPASQVLNREDLTRPISFTTQNQGGITTYNWTNSLSDIGLQEEGSSDIPEFIVLNSGIEPLIAWIRVWPTFNSNSLSCEGSAKQFTIVVTPEARMNDIDNKIVPDRHTCTVNFSSPTSIGVTTYNWSNNNSDIGLGKSGVSKDLIFEATNPGTSPIMATITVTPVYTYDGVSNTGLSKSFTITVNPTASVIQPANQTVCSGSPLQVNFGTVNKGGNTTYTWTNTSANIGLPSQGSGAILMFTAVNNSPSPVTATIMVTPTYENGGVSSSGPGKNFNITVYPVGQVTQFNDLHLYNGQKREGLKFYSINPAGSSSYEWHNSNPAIGLPASGMDSIPAFVAINMGLSPVHASISTLPTYLIDGSNCKGSTSSFTISVIPDGQVNKPLNRVVCTNTTLSLPFTTQNSGGITTYQWVNSNPAIGIPFMGSGNIPEFAAINNSTAPQVSTIWVLPSFSDGHLSRSGESKTFTVTVNPVAQVDQPQDRNLCSGAMTSIPFTTVNTGGTTTYNWVNSNSTIGLAASGMGSISGFVPVNKGTTVLEAIITVTPTFENGSTSCSGPSKKFKIAVRPEGQVNQLPSQILCSGQNPAATIFSTTRNDGQTTFNWTNSNPGIGLAGSGTGAIPDFTALNNGSVASTATITVIPVYHIGSEGCEGPSEKFDLTIHPLPLAVSGIDQEICMGEHVVLGADAKLGNHYLWSSEPAGFVSQLSNPEIAPTVSMVYTLVETIDATGCSNTHHTTVLVKAFFKPEISGQTTLCAETSQVRYATTSILKNYQWTLPEGATIVSGANTNEIYVDFSLAAISGNVKVSGSTGCGVLSVSDNYAVVVHPVPATPIISAQGHTLTSSRDSGNQWYQNGIPLVNEKEKQLTTPEAGNYNTIVVESGCSSAPSNVINLTQADNSNLELVVYPNPNQGQFNLRLLTTQTIDVSIVITDITGKKVWELNNISINGVFNTSIDLGGINQGTYMIKLYNDSINEVRKLLIIK